MPAKIIPASDTEALRIALTVLAGGGLVAIPTETVYGLAADATNDHAIAAIYAAKRRPSFNPLIAHVSSVDMAKMLVQFSETASRLADVFWPGPLTLVLQRTLACPVSELASAGLDTLAVRCPDHDVPRRIIAEFDRPLVAPSANPSGRVSPTTAQHVAEGLGDSIDLILDGGACRVGLESTVIGFTDDKPILLRKGGLTREALEHVCGPLALPDRSEVLASPGMLSSHYAPNASLRLNADRKQAGEVFLGFGGQPGADLDLSPSGDTIEAAANLFSYLRQLDSRGAARIAVASIPEEGLGEAINDRLIRAAAPRDE